jgi:predicted nucleic acid-binding protein
MSAKDWVFLDTNILIYAHDNADKTKQRRARELIGKVSERQFICLSTQVLKEFANACVRKLGLSQADILLLLDEYAKLRVVETTPLLIREAVDVHFVYGYSFYDSLIISTAASAGCKLIYTEDLAHGQTVKGVTLLNPFR